MKRTTISFVLVVTIGLFSYGSGLREMEPDQSQPTREELSVVGLRGPTGVVLASVLNDSPVETEHSVVHASIVASPDVMVSRLVSGEADIGMLPTNVVAQLYNRDIPVQIAAITLWGVLYVVTSNAEIGTWGDLAGRTVYSLSPGSTPDVLFRHLLDQNGVDPNTDVNIDYRYGHVELAQAVGAGLVETAVLPEPFVTSVIQRSDDVRVALDFQTESRRLYGSSYPQTAVVVRRDVAESAPNAVEDALRLIETSLNDALANPEESAKLAQQTEIGLPSSVVVQALPRLNAQYVSATAAGDRIVQYLRVLYGFEPRTVGGRVPDQGLLYSR